MLFYFKLLNKRISFLSDDDNRGLIKYYATLSHHIFRLVIEFKDIFRLVYSTQSH